MSQMLQTNMGSRVLQLNVFLEGDTLVLTLPPWPDFDLYVHRVLHEINQRGHDGIINTLIDCAQLDAAIIPNSEGLVELGSAVISHRIRLLLLDVSPEFYPLFEARLPEAVWIDSNSTGYFGKQLIAKRHARSQTNRYRD